MRKFLLLLLSFSAFLASAQDTLVNYTFTGIGAGGAHVKLDSVRVWYYTNATYDLAHLDRDTLLVFPDTVMYVSFLDESSSLNSVLANENSFVRVERDLFTAGRNIVAVAVSEPSVVRIMMCDMSGRLLSSYNDFCMAGKHRFEVSCELSQVYLLKVEVGCKSETVKLINKGTCGKNEILALSSERSEVLRSGHNEIIFNLPFPESKYCCFGATGYTTHNGKVYKCEKMTNLNNEWIFTFLFDEELEEEGLLPGVFNLSADGSKKIRFSKGNLQYHAVKDEWRFAENQWDFVGEEGNMSAAPDYDGWIDLFAWGTSGYDGKYPYANDICTECGVNFGNSGYDITNTNYDWGVYNAISNGGGRSGIWHTMTDSEWYYLERYRDNADSLRGLATVAGKHGMVLLPEYWDLKAYPVNPDFSEYTDNVYTEGEWKVMEELGAVFFVGAGVVGEWDLGDRVDDDAYTGDFGCYTTSTSMAQNCNYVFSFRDDMYWNGMLISPGEWFVVFGINRSIRTSVRMVQYIINE
jgi:hypothetical protein